MGKRKRKWNSLVEIFVGGVAKEQVTGRLFSRGNNLVRMKGFEGGVSKGSRQVPRMSGSAQIYVLTTHPEHQ